MREVLGLNKAEIESLQKADVPDGMYAKEETHDKSHCGQ
jgi:hypothetical protein